MGANHARNETRARHARRRHPRRPGTTGRGRAPRDRNTVVPRRRRGPPRHSPENGNRSRLAATRLSKDFRHEHADPPPGPTRVDRRLPRVRHVPDDGRGVAPRPDRQGGPGEPVLAAARLSPDPRRVGGLLAARPDPAVLFVPGRGGATIFARPPARERPKLRARLSARRLAGARARLPRRLFALGRQTANEFHLRGYALADRPWIRAALPDRPSAA